MPSVSSEIHNLSEDNNGSQQGKQMCFQHAGVRWVAIDWKLAGIQNMKNKQNKKPCSVIIMTTLLRFEPNQQRNWRKNGDWTQWLLL